MAKARINPVILKWWREELNLDASFVAKKLGKSEEILNTWEEWSDFPTMKQLEHIANIYKTHLSVFYLPQVPEKLKPKIDYRGIDAFLDPDDKYRLEINIFEAVQRKNIATELYEELWIEVAPLPKMKMAAGVDAVASVIRGFLWEKSRITMSSFSGKAPYDVLRFWKTLVESKDIMISQTSSINTHLWIEVNVMRWFCMNGTIPVIVLNSKDSPRGKIFTILHELTHLILGWGNKIQNVVNFRNMDDPTLDAEEVFCNRVAAEILIPSDDFNKIIKEDSFELSSDYLTKIARWYWVSEEVVMRRLLDMGKINRTTYEKFRADNKAKWADKPKSDKVVVPFERRVIWTSGGLFTHLILTAYQREKINLLNVGQFLWTSLNHLPKIENELYGS